MPIQHTSENKIEAEKLIIRNVAKLQSADVIQLNDRGWDSRVYSFNENRHFFKFPRNEKIQKRYLYEIAAIKLINEFDLNIVRQKILWEHPDNEYFGYEGVQGKTVNGIREKLVTGQKELIGDVLGEFLKIFHDLKLPGARTMSLEDESRQIQHWYTNSFATIQEKFTQEEQEKLNQMVYKIWPSKIKELGCDLVLSHGDMHFENILYGENETVGVIDFGDVAYIDRSKDFIELEGDSNIFEAVVRKYGQMDTVLQQKIAIRQAMIQIINFGFHAGKKDEVKLRKTIEKIRKNFL